MPTLGTPANEVQSTLASSFTRGTDTNIVLATGGGADFPSTPQVVRLTDGAHWCLLIYSSKSTDTLVMSNATDYALAQNVSAGDETYTWPIGSTVELVAAADYVTRTFTDLTDTPADYVGRGGDVVLVKTTEDGIETQPWPVVGTTINYFLSNNSADIGSYYYLYPTETGDAYSELTSGSLAMTSFCGAS